MSTLPLVEVLEGGIRCRPGSHALLELKIFIPDCKICARKALAITRLCKAVAKQWRGSIPRTVTLWHPSCVVRHIYVTSTSLAPFTLSSLIRKAVVSPTAYNSDFSTVSLQNEGFGAEPSLERAPCFWSKATTAGGLCRRRKDKQGGTNSVVCRWS